MIYLTIGEVLAIHDVLVDLFGGADGVRDMGALESAVHRPQSGYYADVVAEAAALWESLIMNHPFVDGNKRTAVAAADVHLRLNGMMLNVPPGAAYEFIQGLFSENAMHIDRIEPWIRDHVVDF